MSQMTFEYITARRKIQQLYRHHVLGVILAGTRLTETLKLESMDI